LGSIRQRVRPDRRLSSFPAPDHPNQMSKRSTGTHYEHSAIRQECQRSNAKIFLVEECAERSSKKCRDPGDWLGEPNACGRVWRMADVSRMAPRRAWRKRAPIMDKALVIATESAEFRHCVGSNGVAALEYQLRLGRRSRTHVRFDREDIRGCRQRDALIAVLLEGIAPCLVA
jgi:hypothetical protein